MKKPQRKRIAPDAKAIGQPAGVDLGNVAAESRYVGSAAHKVTPSFAGNPRPRSDASICDHALSNQQAQVEGWLRVGISRGATSAVWEGGFPRFVWFKRGAEVYLARHSRNGDFHGWPVEELDDVPEEIDAIDFA